MKEPVAFFESESISALDAKGLAQWIAFGPMVFQAARVLRNTGILEVVENANPFGITQNEILEKVPVTEYGTRVLLESGLSIGLVVVDDAGRYNITKTGSFIVHDALTRTNMDFVHDVCYKAMYTLDKSIENGKPVGLSLFGEWNTIYEGLSELPSWIQKSWLAFDHFFSDDGFEKVLNHVMANNPKNLIDIGGNTGRWATLCAKKYPYLQISIMDLPGQLEMAEKELIKNGFREKVTLIGANILDDHVDIPSGFDVIWMSQFLDCFSEDQVVAILKKCHRALDSNGSLFIMEPFWDRQKFRTAAFCLHQTSLYFTALANGNSQMYSSQTFKNCVQKSGFTITKQQDNIGMSQTLLTCKKD